MSQLKWERRNENKDNSVQSGKGCKQTNATIIEPTKLPENTSRSNDACT